MRESRIPFCLALSTITRRTLRRISSTPPHRADSLSRKPAECPTHSLGLDIMRQPFSNESTSTCVVNLRGGGGVWPALPHCLSLSFPASQLPCLTVPSSTAPSHPLWPFYTSLPGSTMAHCGLPSSEAPDGGGNGAALPFWPVMDSKGWCRDILRRGLGRAVMMPVSQFPSDHTASYCTLDLSSGSNGYASLSSEHRCLPPAALQQIHK